MAEAKIALHLLNAGLVLDRSVFVGQTAAEMQITVDMLRVSSLKKTATVIDSATSFFTSANMLELIKANNPAYKLIAEKAGVTLRDEDVQAIIAAETTKAVIIASMTPPIPPYPFQSVPEGFKVTDVFELCNGNKSFRRKGRSECISLIQGELIWRYLSDAWSKNKPVVSKYFRDNRVSEEIGSIRVGCQRAYRYEIEQIAIWRGWKFPVKA